MENIDRKFGSEIAGGCVIIRQGNSLDMLFQDGAFDWICIDPIIPLHALGKLADCNVKQGGKIAGHDFCTGNQGKPVVMRLLRRSTNLR